MRELNLRQVRAFIAVAEHGSVTKGASSLNKSQTSITKTIHDFETSLGFKLFKRTPRGVQLTAHGTAFYPKTLAAYKQFESAKELVPQVHFDSSASAKHFFRMDVSSKWLDAFIATVEAKNIAAAANSLGVTTAAISSSLRKFEDSLGISLFERSPIAIEPTIFSRSIYQRIKLARNFLRQGLEAMASIEGATRGQVVIGTLPYIGTQILPSAILNVLKSHPQLEISTAEAPYDDLIRALRCGDVDFVMGPLRGKKAARDLEEFPLLDDELALVVRPEHPILEASRITWTNLLQYSWVLPQHGTPIRTLIRSIVSEHGLHEPEQIVETGSFMILRGLVMDSDLVTILARNQCIRELQSGQLIAAEMNLPRTELSGITTRLGQNHSPATELLINSVKAVVENKIGKESDS